MQDKVSDTIGKSVDDVSEAIKDSSIWQNFVKFLEFKLFDFSYGTQADAYHITLKVKYVLLVILVVFLTSYFLRWSKKIVTRKMRDDDKIKFNTVFSFVRWVIYCIVLLISLDAIGVDVTGIFAASAALLIGVGLALQTLFQDIISGIFILIDQSVHAGDIIELEGKTGKVVEIKLRTTRAVTLDNKVMVIPNHLYLTNSLYNWTQNGKITREYIDVGVAYGSDTELVKELLLQVANDHELVLKTPEPMVLFSNFGDSALEFKLVFTPEDCFRAVLLKSDMRFSINTIFKAHNISIPFPQRDIHIISQPQK